jgi:O-antigen/teichoic acid export membrane protein
MKGATAVEGSSARLVRNTLANGVGSIGGVLVSLAMTPFLIRGLGFEAYGVFTLALSLTFFGGYAALADLGVEGAAVRYIAEARAAGDPGRVSAVVSTAAAFFLAVALVLTPPLVLAAEALTRLFEVSADLRAAASWCFALVAGQLLFELPARAFVAVLQGSQSFGWFQALEGLRALLQAALFAGVLVTGTGIVGLGAAMMLTSAVVLIAAWALARRAVAPRLRVAPRHASRAVLRQLVTFGGGLFAIRLLGTIYRQMDKVILGIALGVPVVTIYEVANKIHAGAVMVLSIAASALPPSAAFARNRHDVLRDMYLRGTSLTLGLSLPVTLAAFIFAEPLVLAWVGEELRAAVGPTRLFLVYVVFVAAHMIGVSIVVSLGRLRVVAIAAAVNVGLNLAISVALVGPLGIEGVLLGTLVGELVVWPALFAHFLRQFRVGGREWARVVLRPLLPGLAAQAATALPLLHFAQRWDNLGAVGALALLSVASSVAAFARLGLAPDQRRALAATLRRVSGRPAFSSPAS